MGEVFAGRYELVDPLGAGGMGTVWRTWDHRRGQYVAAKLMRQSDASALIRFVREQSFRVAHPHVVAPDSWAGSDEQVLLAMPIVRGGSVSMLLKDFGTLPADWAAVLTSQLLEALEAVHTAGLVHRDVKPGNLLLHPTGRARPYLLLSDFGIAAGVGEPRLTRASAVVGTPGYLAPEQLAGADPDPRQDLYSCGVVLHEMLTGIRPAHRVDERGFDDVTGPLHDVVRTLTARQPRGRPQTAAEARRLLVGTGLLDGPDPAAADVEVFDHLPALPAGWGPAGKVSAEPATPAPVTPAPVAPAVSPPGWSTRGQPERNRALPWSAIALGLLGAVLLAAALVTAVRG